MNRYYFVEKSGIYKHGVFWIGTDEAEACAVAKDLASMDIDDYHSWDVLEHRIQTNFREDAKHKHIASFYKDSSND